MLGIILQLPLFLVLTIVFFSLPGIFVLQKTKLELSSWEKITLGTIVGFVIFTLISYLLLFLNLELLIFPLLLVPAFLTLKKLHLPKFSLTNSQLFIFLLVLTIGVFGQLLVISPSGAFINNDLVFWSAHGHDGVWHLALVEEIKKGLPLQNPVFGGERLVNYHYFSDISIAVFNKFFSLSSLDLYFRFFPLLFSLLLGTLTFSLGKKLGRSLQSGIWAMIMTYFAGSFGYLVSLPRNGSLESESIFWSSQVQSVSGNPPQHIAFIILLGFILIFVKFLEKPTIKLMVLLGILAGSLSEFKIYAAIVLLSALLITAIWQILRNREFKIMGVFIIGSLVAAILYLPNTAFSQNLLIFEPWWFIRTMIVADNRLNWLDLELRRQTYLAHQNWKWVIGLEAFAFLIFLFGNLGMRFLGFYELFKNPKKYLNDYTRQLIFLILFFSLLFPLLFIQKGVPGNTIQFLQYFLLFFGILSGISVAQILEKIKLRTLRIIVSSLIIILAIPTQIGLIYQFYKQPPFTKIDSTEFRALKKLTQLTPLNSTILTPPFQKPAHGKTPPIWIWSDTAYIPAFSARKTYISDVEQLDIMGYDYQPRLSVQNQIFSTSDKDLFQTLLKQNKIDYLYFPKVERPKIDLSQTNLQNIYSNDEIEIWKVI